MTFGCRWLTVGIGWINLVFFFTSLCPSVFWNYFIKYLLMKRWSFIDLMVFAKKRWNEKSKRQKDILVWENHCLLICNWIASPSQLRTSKYSTGWPSVFQHCSLCKSTARSQWAQFLDNCWPFIWHSWSILSNKPIPFGNNKLVIYLNLSSLLRSGGVHHSRYWFLSHTRDLLFEKPYCHL